MEQKLYDAAAKLPETDLAFENIPIPEKAPAVRHWRKIAVLAACMALLITAGFGAYAYAAEIKEYNQAVQFFAENGLSTEGLTRGEVKAVCKDITSESFTHEKTAAVIINSFTLAQRIDCEKQQIDLEPANAEQLWKYKMLKSAPASAENYIRIIYGGNPDNVLTVNEPRQVSKLLAWIREAKECGKQGESTRGYYGATFCFYVYEEGQEKPMEFILWDANKFSTPEHTDSSGYPYFFEADMTALYEYMVTHYPSDFWYPYYKGGEISGKKLADGEYETSKSFAGIMESRKIKEGALNASTMSISSVQHLPIYKFDTLEEFRTFKDEIYSNYEPTLECATEMCNRSFFANNTLLLVYVPGYSTNNYEVHDVSSDGTTLLVTIKTTLGEKVSDPASTRWFLLVAVPDSMVENCTIFDAYDVGYMQRKQSPVSQ